MDERDSASSGRDPAVPGFVGRVAPVAAVRADDGDIEAALARGLALLRSAQPRQADLSSFVKPGQLVLVKPNLVAPFPEAVTDFRLITAVVRAVQAAGATAVIGDGSGFEFDTEATLRILGLYELGKRLGAEVRNFEREALASIELARGPVRRVRVPELVMRADAIINLPKLKCHSLTRVTLAQKNLFGLIDKDSRRRIHSMDIEAGVEAVAAEFEPVLTVMDALTVMTRAVYGEQKAYGGLLLSADQVALDVACCGLMGVPASLIGHVRLGMEHRGLTEDAVAAARVGEFAALEQLAVDQGTSLSKRFYRGVFQSMYLLDRPWTRLGRPSFIPSVHLYLGIRPRIDLAKCDGCGDCLGSCPIDAIEVPGAYPRGSEHAGEVVGSDPHSGADVRAGDAEHAKARIDYAKCKYVRCLRCVQACPREAIYTSGFRRQGA